MKKNKSTKGLLSTKKDRNGFPLVIILTALPLEGKAVLSHLKEVQNFTGKSKNTYKLGKFFSDDQDYLVVLGITGPGNEASSDYVVSLRDDFAEIDLILFVGIAGSLKKDVKIGDVIVANIVYSYQSASAGLEMISRPRTKEPQNSFIQAASITSVDDGWLKRINIKEQNPQNTPPQVIIKPIASGEHVVKNIDSPSYKYIKENFADACACETEGYGFQRKVNDLNIPGIVIRGISDVCENKEVTDTQGWQKMAALNASAFAFEILSVNSELIIQLPSPLSPTEVKDYQDVSGINKINESIIKKTQVVLKLNANREDINQEELIDLIRQVTGDDQAEIEDIKDGSVELVIQMQADEAGRFIKNFRKGITRSIGEIEIITTYKPEELSFYKNYKKSLRDSSVDLLQWTQTLPKGEWIERKELDQIHGILETNESSTVILLGEPGSGKSALLSKLATNLHDSQKSFLAIKADMLPLSVKDFSSLSNFLGLDSDILDCINLVSAVEPLVLIIDQLDALGNLVDLKSERLNVMLNLIRRLGDQTNIRIVASCRSFEFQHDVRLNAIHAEHLVLEPPLWPQIEEILKENEILPSVIPENMKEVLRIPQCLKIFLELGDGKNELELVADYHSMLNKLWEERVLPPKGIKGAAALLSQLAINMAEDETIWLAKINHEESLTLINHLVAVNILVLSRDGNKIGFTHQTLFEHSLARSFIKEKQGLAKYILRRQDGLFVRPRAWHALAYLRATDPLAYIREFKIIWESKDLKTHLRLLFIEFLGKQARPLNEEVLWLLPSLNSKKYRKRILRAIAGSPGWFEKVHITHLPKLMEKNIEEAWECLPVMELAWTFSPEIVLNLIKEKWLEDKLKDILSWSSFSCLNEWNQQTIDAIKPIVSRTNIGDIQVCILANTISMNKPELAPQLILAKMEKNLIDVEREKESSPKPPEFPAEGTSEEQVEWNLKFSPKKSYSDLIENNGNWYELPEIAMAAPESYIEVLWPWYLKIFNKLAEEKKDNVVCYRMVWSMAINYAWRGRSDPDRFPITAALKESVEKIAETNFDKFKELIVDWEKSDLMPVHRLISFGLKKIGEKDPDFVFNYLIGDQRRFAIGGSDYLRRNTRELLKIITPNLNSNKIKTLETEIKKYDFYKIKLNSLSAKDKQRWVKSNRNHRFDLLTAFPVDRLSSESKKLISEEERVFSEIQQEERDDFELKEVKSPMFVSQMRKAKDEDINNIFDEIDDKTEWRYSAGLSKGGNVQLSREFAEFAKELPERAIKIIRKFDPNKQTRAAGYAMDAIAETEYPSDKYFKIILELDRKGFKGDNFYESCANGIQKKIKDVLSPPQKIYELLESWLRQLKKKELSEESGFNKGEDRNESVLWGYGGIYTVPHINYPILETLSKGYLTQNPPEVAKWLKLLSNHLKRKENPNTWKALYRFMRYLDFCEPKQASTFLSKLFKKYPEVVGSVQGAILISDSIKWADQKAIQSWLKLLINSGWTMGAQAYGEILVLHAFQYPDKKWSTSRISTVLSKNVTKKKKILYGMCHTAVHLWSDERFKNYSTELLIKLMPGADVYRSKAILDLFRVCKQLEVRAETNKILEGLCKHPDVIKHGDPTFLIDRIQDLLPYESKLVYKVCALILNLLSGEIRDISTSLAGSASDLINIALTLHRLEGVNRRNGLALFEKLLEIDAYDAEATLKQLDGRPLGGRPPRLARRRRRRK